MIPSAVGVASAGRPAANLLLHLYSLLVEAGSFVPYFLAASAACDAASAAAAAAAAAGTQHLGAAGTDCDWPCLVPTLVLLPVVVVVAAAVAAAASFDVFSLGDPETGETSPNDSY